MSYSVTREKAPIYTMGSPDVRAYSRNKRGVAGSLIWINFDRHALLNVFHKARGKFLANKDDIRPQFRMGEQAALDQTAIFNSALARTAGGAVGTTIDQLDNLSLSEVSGFKELATLGLGPVILPDPPALACRGLETLGQHHADEAFRTDFNSALQAGKRDLKPTKKSSPEPPN